ncbi:MAG: glycosyltransferase [Candidatus Electrothrix sp. AX5]|nr:glycosyltransferase [Candidatus Electrothrix sp. AX5]
MQRMFHDGIPVIAVSQALMKDIVHFAGTDCFSQYIVPNVVNPEIFYHRKKDRSHNKPVFLMVANWASIKRPLLVMRAFADILQDFPEAQLRIVGYGQQWENMQAFVNEHNLESNIDLLGSMNKSSIAKEMQQASCFVHASDYETFSVVCAEALCCGVPVIASDVGGISEFVNESNGILVKNSHQTWVDALEKFMQRREPWDAHKISRTAIARFSPHEIGAKLLEVYEQSKGGR